MWRGILLIKHAPIHLQRERIVDSEELAHRVGRRQKRSLTMNITGGGLVVGESDVVDRRWRHTSDVDRFEVGQLEQ